MVIWNSWILVMTRLYWDRIMAGEKTLEIRNKRLKPKRYLVGRQGEIWGTLVLEPGQVIQTDEEWRALLPSHCWHVDKRPYKQTYAMSLGKVESFTTSIGYATKMGQQSIAKYRPPDCSGEEGVRARVGGRKRPSAAL